MGLLELLRIYNSNHPDDIYLRVYSSGWCELLYVKDDSAINRLMSPKDTLSWLTEKTRVESDDRVYL